MARLYRPYIPLAVRVKVAARQVILSGALGPAIQVGIFDTYKSAGDRLGELLRHLFGDKPFALDHNPALMNRKRCGTGKQTVYSPPANHPDYLVYREAGPGSDHDIKTRVRGDGAQHSDLALARIAKRKAKKKTAGGPASLRPRRLGRPVPKAGKRAPTRHRPFRSASRWPPKGSRKVNWKHRSPR